MAEKIKILCDQLLRTEDITVIQLVADELQGAIRAYVGRLNKRPLIVVVS